MANTTTPNMSLVVPTVGSELGPTYALEINADFTILDEHDHSAGKGVQITPSGLSITSDLSFQANSATNLLSLRLNQQPSALVTLDTVYDVLGDLYFNDGNGNQIQITSAGSVNGAPGNITNLIPPAALTYVPGTPAFVATSSPGVPASWDGGSVVIRRIVAASNGITLTAPASLPGNYSLTFPSALPASSKIARVDNSGNLSLTLDVDNSTIEISGNNLQVKALGITNTQLASGAALANLASGSVTYAKLQASNITLSGSVINGVATTTGYVTQGSAISHLCKGRPVAVYLVPGSGVTGFFSCNQNALAVLGTSSPFSVRILRDDAVFWDIDLGTSTPSQQCYTYVGLSSVSIIDLDTTDGVTHTYEVQMKVTDATHVNATIANGVLVAEDVL